MYQISKKDYYSKNFMGNSYNYHIAYVENNYIQGLMIYHSITQITYIKIQTNIQLMLFIFINQQSFKSKTENLL